MIGARLAATARCDARLQARNGFYAAVAFLLAGFAIVVSQLPELDWAPLLPALLFGNVSVATFYFLAGLVLLEKGEGTLEAQVVTPLSPGEYLASKVATLTVLSLVECFAIVLVAHGPGFRWMPLVLGVALASALYCLAGFAVVARYDSINEFLFPSMLYTTLFLLPLVDYAGLWESPLVYFHPFQAPLVLLEAAFFPVERWQWLYGVAYSALWIAVAFRWSVGSFRRFVMAQAGGR